MLAALIEEPRRAALSEQPLPELAPGQARIRLDGCGVCGSDLPVWQGRSWFDYPRAAGAPGHEPWGVVEEVGSAVTRLRPGDRVTGLMYRSYSQYDVGDEDALVALPDELKGEPFPGEPLACAVNVFRRSGVRPGDTVAVVGIGFLGALVLQLAARAGARVLALSRRPFALEMAARMGAEETIGLADDPVRQVTELTEGRLCDVVIEAAGAQSTLNLATPLTRTRGRLVIAGFHQDGQREVDMQLWNWRGLDVINAHERDPRVYVEGLRQAVEAVTAGHLDPSPLYTHRFPLSDLGSALETLEKRPEGFMKALVLS